MTRDDERTAPEHDSIRIPQCPSMVWETAHDPLAMLMQRCRGGFSWVEWEGIVRYVHWVSDEVRKYPLRELVIKHLQRQWASGVSQTPEQFLDQLPDEELALLGDSFRIEMHRRLPIAS